MTSTSLFLQSIITSEGKFEKVKFDA